MSFWNVTAPALVWKLNDVRDVQHHIEIDEVVAQELASEDGMQHCHATNPLFQVRICPIGLCKLFQHRSEIHSLAARE